MNTATFPSTTDENGTFIREVLSGVRNLETSTLFYKNQFGAVQGTQVTTDDLSEGTMTTALNADRTGDEAPWVQQEDQPMLKVFASEGGIITGIDSGQRSKGLTQRDGWYTIDGRKLYGKPMNKGIYINNGNKVVIK